MIHLTKLDRYYTEGISKDIFSDPNFRNRKIGDPGVLDPKDRKPKKWGQSRDSRTKQVYCEDTDSVISFREVMRGKYILDHFVWSKNGCYLLYSYSTISDKEPAGKAGSYPIHTVKRRYFERNK